MEHLGPAAAPIKPPNRCAQPGHKKAQREAQEKELGTRGGGGAAAAAAQTAYDKNAAKPSSFTLLARAGGLDGFLEVDPDKQAAVLEKMAAHNKELKRKQHHG